MTDDDRKQFWMLHAPAYMTGLSAALAVAIHRRTGWELVAIADPSGPMAHCGVRGPDGRFADARGILDEDAFRAPFGGAVTAVTEAELTARGIGEPEIARAAVHASLLLPDLPGMDERQQRLLTFAEGLERLCRETGVWIRSDGPWGIPAYDAYGDEGPFDVTFGPDGAARVERTLGRVSEGEEAV